MHESWLRPNRRAIVFGCAPLVVLMALGVWMAGGSSDFGPGWRWLGVATSVGAAVGIAWLLSQLRRPRVGYRDGSVLFFLTSGGPISVPVETVEAFFVGQGPATLPGGVGKQQRTYNLVARLAQRETDWANRDVKPALGEWKDSYVVIRGAWCEPLDDEVIRRLNRRLREVKEELRVEG